MRWACVLITAVLFANYSNAQENDAFSSDASKLAGQWIDANGDSILINKVRFGWDVWLAKQGQSSLVPSDGRGGSHVKLAGRTREDKSFECFYYISFVDKRTMTWSFRDGDKEICPKSGVIKSTLPPEPEYNADLLGTNIVYYTKRADRDTVTKALADAKVKYTPGMSSNGQENPTVAIACTDDVSGKKIKTLAKILLNGGVQLRSISKIENKSKRNVLEIVSQVNDFGVIESPELTMTQINQIDSCPDDLSNDFVENFDIEAERIYTHTGEGNSTELETAEKFCRHEYFASVEKFTVLKYSGNIAYIDDWAKNGEPDRYPCKYCNIFKSISCKYR